MMIAQKAFDFIVAQEVSSKAYYERHYTHPEWPGGASGITVAIGYDLGYATVQKIIIDWSAHVSDEMLQVMKSCAGVKGTAARALLPKVKAAINIPWDMAIEVFKNRDVPAWTATVQNKVPNTAKVGSLCLGVLVSTAYNRGASFDLPGDRYAEMRDIKAHMTNQTFRLVSGDLIHMCRLWPTVKGLRDRRKAEAALWDEGLANPPTETEAAAVPTSQPDPEVPLNEGPARTKPPATTPAQHSTAVALIGSTAAVASQASHAGASTSTVLGIATFGTVVAATTWLAWYRNRNPK